MDYLTKLSINQTKTFINYQDSKQMLYLIKLRLFNYNQLLFKRKQALYKVTQWVAPTKNQQL